MYEELAKMLRTCAERDSCIGWREACPYLGTGVCDNKAGKAADAIEELSAYARQFEDLRKNGYYLQKTKMMTYGQATMTMPLPEPPKEET